MTTATEKGTSERRAIVAPEKRSRVRIKTSPDALADRLEAMATLAPALRDGTLTRRQLNALQLETRRVNALVRRLLRKSTAPKKQAA